MNSQRLIIGLLVFAALFSRAAGAAPVADLVLERVLAVDRVGEHTALSPAADLLAVQLHRRPSDGAAVLRLSFLSLSEDVPGRLAAAFVAAGRPAAVAVDMRPANTASAAHGSRSFALTRNADAHFRTPPADKGATTALFTKPDDPDAVYLVLDEDPTLLGTVDRPWQVTFTTSAAGRSADELSASYPSPHVVEAHCALVLHGNQGIGYTDVLHGRGDDLEGSGFDEALQAHESNGVPGNFHMSGTLMSAAEWAARNGDPTDFNAWLAGGVSAGWAGMITSAYGQHMMPFVNNEMNDWSVEIQAQMVNTRYGYWPRVAWVPERVWLNTTGYPSSGVNDWIGDNWTNHGVDGVILDDDVHLAGHDNHRIHFLNGNGLRLIPRDRTFTGNIIGGNGQGSLDILTGLANSGVGEFRIAVFAEDWEAASEMGGWADIVPNATETYDWFIGKCATESAWLHTWKLADALDNPNFNGDTMDVAPGTYNEIGGADGYGGGDNGWYTHWAGFVPYVTGGDGNGICAGAGGNCKNYGTLWNEAYGALLAAPDNNLSQAGWYVMMTNLHETAWHDGLGGAISGWQHKYSAHIKNAMIYAEAAHWAAGEYVTTTDAYFHDIDNDGYDEVVIHNDRLFGVFEGNGGRLTHLFVKGPGYDDTAIGVDNAYWSETEGDFNDPNHVGAFSEVSPNYQHDAYSITPTVVGGAASLVLTRNEVEKTVSLATGDSFFDVIYDLGPATHWVQAGFSPSLVDLVWNAELQRVWAPDASYMGFRNPNTGIAAAFVLGAGGADHQKEISGTLMKGDEIMGSGVLQLQLYAGPTSAPDGTGDIAELRLLADNLVDTIGPDFTGAQYYLQSDRLQVRCDQASYLIDAAGFTIVGQTGSVVLPGATPVVETQPTANLTFELDAVTAATLEALILAGDLHLQVTAGALEDPAGNGNPALAPPTLPVLVNGTAVAIDGHIEAGEWQNAQVLADENDSAWTAANEIDRLLVQWDADYLYLAIDGVVNANSWLLYLDIDPGTANGETDLTAIDTWERGALFTAAGFAADFQYGCYQHQSASDGDGFWQLLSPTTTQDRADEITSAFDSFHNYGDAGGSELAIPWDMLYGLGSGAVPVGAQLSLVASVCWDPEPDGVLGGDSVPNNTGAALPTLDTVWTLAVDADGDGRPDGTGVAASPAVPRVALRLLPNVPNPFNPSTTIFFDVPGSGATPVGLVIYDLRGRQVRTLAQDSLLPGRHSRVWDGRNDRGHAVAAGTYFARLESSGRVVTRPLSLVK